MLNEPLPATSGADEALDQFGNTDTFWRRTRIAMLTMALLVALHMYFSFAGEAGMELSLIISSIASIMTLVWIIANRFSPYWKEFRAHVKEFGKMGWGLYLAENFWFYIPSGAMYIRAPQRIRAGIVVMSLVDYALFAWLAVVSFDYVRMYNNAINMTFIWIVMFIYCAAFATPWLIAYAKRARQASS
jgi:hypothetical protein